MKKIVSLLIAIALVLSMATVAFAANNTSWNAPESVEELPGTVTLEAGEVMFYRLPTDYSGWKLSVSGGDFTIHNSNPMYGGWGDVYSVNGAAEVELSQNSMDGITIGINNTGAETKTFTLAVTPPPVGAQGNPAELKLDENNTCFTFEQGYMGYMYFFEYTATEGGYLTVDLVSAAASQYSFDLSNDIYDTAWSSDSPNNDTATIGVRAGGTVVVAISAVLLDGNNQSAAAVAITASFEGAEEGTKYNPIVIEDAAKEYSFEVPVNNADFTWISLSDVKGATLTVEDADAVIGTMMWDMQMADPETGILSVEVYEDSYITGVKTAGDDTKYTVTVSEPEGYDENPALIEDISSVDAYVPGYGVDDYFYYWTATEAGRLTLNAAAAWDESEVSWGSVLDENGDPLPVPFTLTAGVAGTEGISDASAVMLDVKAGDVVIIKLSVEALEDDYAARSITVALTGAFDALGSANNPIVVNMASELTGINVAADGETYIAVNSALNGMILNIGADANATVTVNGNEVEAVNGLFSVELTGVPTNRVVVANSGENAAAYIASIEYAPGTENNPIVVESAKDLTSAAVAADSKVYYAVSSRLTGTVLTVKGADAYVIVNGTTKVSAVDGVVTVDLTANGATIPVVIGNAGTADATYETSIDYAPIAINAAGDFTADVAAGAEVKYVVNSKLAGAILTVKGEGAYIDMNGTKVAAVDGVASVVLDGEGATISVAIGNAGTAAAKYEASIAYAPTAINAAGDYKVTVPAGSEVEYLVNSKLDGAVLTVKGEGAYAIINGTKVEAKDGVVTAELKASAATISVVIGNAGTAAAEYQFSITVPSDIPETGDTGVMISIASMIMSAFGGVAMVAKKKEF